MEKFGFFALEGMSDELQCPAKNEQAERVDPERVEEESGNRQQRGEEDGRDAEGVAGAVDRMLVAGGILGNPLFAGAVTQHGWESYTLPAP